jgi:hypothetical protein
MVRPANLICKPTERIACGNPQRVMNQIVSELGRKPYPYDIAIRSLINRSEYTKGWWWDRIWDTESSLDRLPLDGMSSVLHDLLSPRGF